MTVWADERGSGSKSKLNRCFGPTFDAKANGDPRNGTKWCPDSMYVFMSVAGNDRKSLVADACYWQAAIVGLDRELIYNNCGGHRGHETAETHDIRGTRWGCGLREGAR